MCLWVFIALQLISNCIVLYCIVLYCIALIRYSVCVCSYQSTFASDCLHVFLSVRIFNCVHIYDLHKYSVFLCMYMYRSRMHVTLIVFVRMLTCMRLLSEPRRFAVWKIWKILAQTRPVKLKRKIQNGRRNIKSLLDGTWDSAIATLCLYLSVFYVGQFQELQLRHL